MKRLLIAFVAAALCACESEGAQVADVNADVSVAAPAFAEGAGPSVVIDGAHNNYHQIDGRYAPFAALLRNDGLRVEGAATPFSDSTLADIDVLVIANAESESGEAAFAQEEIDAVRRYVENGGALLLIADHTPFAGAAADLAAAFGVAFEDVFAEDDGSGDFTRRNGGLTDDPLLANIERVRTFSGSAFRVTAPGARPLLQLDADWTIQHMVATGLSEKTSAAGMLQGAVLEVGQGRVAVFGEAAMFTAQIEDSGMMRQRTGFNARGAAENKQLILNVMRWLARAPAT